MGCRTPRPNRTFTRGYTTWFVITPSWGCLRYRGTTSSAPARIGSSKSFSHSGRMLVRSPSTRATALASRFCASSSTVLTPTPLPGPPRWVSTTTSTWVGVAAATSRVPSVEKPPDTTISAPWPPKKWVKPSSTALSTRATVEAQFFVQIPTTRSTPLGNTPSLCDGLADHPLQQLL